MPLMQGGCGRHYQGTSVKGHGHGLGNVIGAGRTRWPLPCGPLADDWQKNRKYGKLFLPWGDLNDWVGSVLLRKGSESKGCCGHESQLKAARVSYKLPCCIKGRPGAVSM